MNTSSTTTACVGASFTLRIVVDMVVRAKRALGTARKDLELLFAASEVEARALIERKRQAKPG